MRDDAKLQDHIIDRDNGQPLKFHGQLVAEVHDNPNSDHPNYSGSSGKWTELKLWRTRGGNWIVARISHTCWQGEYDRVGARTARTDREVAEYFGHSRLAKELYAKAGLVFVEEVE